MKETSLKIPTHVVHQSAASLTIFTAKKFSFWPIFSLKGHVEQPYLFPYTGYNGQIGYNIQGLILLPLRPGTLLSTDNTNP